MQLDTHSKGDCCRGVHNFCPVGCKQGSTVSVRSDHLRRDLFLSTPAPLPVRTSRAKITLKAKYYYALRKHCHPVNTTPKPSEAFAVTPIPGKRRHRLHLTVTSITSPCCSSFEYLPPYHWDSATKQVYWSFLDRTPPKSTISETLHDPSNARNAPRPLHR